MRQGFRRLLALRGGLAVLTVALLSVAACENNRTKLSKEQSEGGLSMSDVSSDHTKKFTIDPRCNLNEEVIEPKENTPEWAIYQILDAARSEKDDEETFQKFYAQFDPETEAESWVRQQYWPRARKHVSKYLQGDPSQGVVYKICDRRPEGEGKVKIFIQSTDPSKSNPPIALKKDDAGKWKVVFYTP